MPSELSRNQLRVVMLYDLDPEWEANDQAAADRETRRLGFALRRQGLSVAFTPVTTADLTAPLSAFSPEQVVVFNWCEGLPGVEHSEPKVARLLETMNFTYTGSTAEVLELSYNKPAIKRLLESVGAPTPRWAVFDQPEIGEWTEFPAIVKLAWEHFSLGIDEGSVVFDRDEMARRVSQVLGTYRQPALVEEFIDGREFHVPVWGNDCAEVLPPVEMDFRGIADARRRVCSYEAKFDPDSEGYSAVGTLLPAPLTEAEMEELRRVTRLAYTATGCRDYGRVDLRLRDGVFYVLDVNPNADVSADASVALAAGEAGFSYGALGSRLLEMAAARHPQNLAPHQ